MNLKIFENPEFGSIRTIMLDGEPYFVGRDVAKILGYANPNDALVKRVDEEDKGVAKCDTLGGIQELTVINESGLYSLILSSKLPKAKQFKRWVTSEILPSIRKNGGYITGQESMTDDELLSAALKVANRKIEEKNRIIKEMEPKAIFADAVSASKTSILIGELSKIICQNGVEIGQKRLFQWLRDNGFLMKIGESKNMPTQKSMDMGLFEIKESSVLNADGSNRITRTTKVTGKGQIYFLQRFLIS